MTSGAATAPFGSPMAEKWASTPLSQASTAPSTPMQTFHFDPFGEAGQADCGKRFRSRTASAQLSEEPSMERTEEESKDDGEDEKDCHCENEKGSVHGVLASNSRRWQDDSDDGEEYEVLGELCCMTWITNDEALAKVKASTYNGWMEELEDKLVEVKAMYKSKYGQDVDDEDEEEASDECEYDEEGVLWMKTVGCGASHQQAVYVERLEAPDEALAEVKALYHSRYGHYVEEHVYDEEGTLWIKTIGNGIQQLEETDQQDTVESSEAATARGYKIEYEYDVENAMWIKAYGNGASVRPEAYR